jgi:phage terminase Nu1 subunit (DNA packaging protein)
LVKHVTWPEVVSTADMATLLGVDTLTVRNYVQRDIMHKASPAVGSGLLFLPSVQSYIKHLREVASGRSAVNVSGLSITEESALLKREQRLHYELKNQLASGEMVLASDIRPAWARSILSIRAAMLALPGKARIMLGLDSQEAKTLTDLVHDVLKAAANPPKVVTDDGS